MLEVANATIGGHIFDFLSNKIQRGTSQCIDHKGDMAKWPHLFRGTAMARWMFPQIGGKPPKWMVNNGKPY